MFVAPLLDALPAARVIDLIGAVDLLTAAACLARCEIYIGNDSGLMHMAAAMGAPTLGLFGPSLPERYGPWGPNTGWVRTDKDLDEIVGAPGYDHRTAATQMDSLPVDRVVEAATQLRRRTLEQAV
ncbi:MAG: glycosyltransferase family 9 protein [Alphaproteobacteria bacterium]